jgi:hypothetical protein
MNVTTNEMSVLRALMTNFFITNGAEPTSYEQASAETWSDSINDASEPSSLEGKALAGVCGSLAAKGLVRTGGKGTDSWIALTPSGYEAAKS